MSLFAYFRHSRAISKDSEKALLEYRNNNPEPTIKEKIQNFFQEWKESSFADKVIFTLLSPIYLFMLLLFIPVALLTILFSPFLLVILICGIICYTIPSILIGGSIDITRQIFVRKKDVWFKKWKYTDKMLGYWELTPYRMSIQGYLDFKQKLYKGNR